MSGLTPTKSQDEILGLDDPPDPLTFLTLPRGGAREVHRQAPRGVPRRTTATSSSRSSRRNNHAIEAIITTEERSASVATPIRSWSRTGWWPRSTIPTRDHDPDRRADQPARDARRDPGPAAEPGEHNVEILGCSATATPRSPRSVERWTDGCARRRAPDRLRPVPRRAVRADDPRRPRRRGHQGRAGHRRRHAARREAVLRLPARQARHRAQPQDHRGLEIALELVEPRRRRAPQHDGGRRDRLGIDYDDCKRVNPDVVYCNTWAYGLEGPLAPLRRPRPALPGVGRARVRGRRRPTPATRRCTTGSGCATRRTRCCRSSASSPRCSTARAPARARSCGRRSSTAARSSRPTRCSSTARPCPGPRMDQGLHGTGACYRLYDTQDGWIQVAAVKESRVGGPVRRARLPELADDARFAVADLRAEHRRARSPARAPLPREDRS